MVHFTPAAEAIAHPEGWMQALSPILSVAVAVAGGLLALRLWGRPGDATERLRARYAPAASALEHKLWFDELYDTIFYKPAVLLTAGFRRGIEEPLIGGSIAGVTASAREAGGAVGDAQTGYLRSYALAIALGVAILLTVRELASPWEQVFEGFAALTAVAVLTYMIFWMSRHAREIRGELQRKMDETIDRGRLIGVAAIAFVTVFREGVETVLFLTPLGVTDPAGTALGFLVGLVAVLVLAVVMFRGTARLDIRKFFTTTSILLIVFAAGLTAIGVHEFNEVYELTGLGIPPVVDHVWDTSAVLAEASPAGLILKSLVGYNANPSLTEVLAYLAYWVIVGGAALRLFGPGLVRASLRRLRVALVGKIGRGTKLPERDETAAP